MARFDVHKIAGAPGYYLDIQADFHSQFDTRVVVPLLPADGELTPAKYLNPCFQIDETEVIMMTEYMAAVSRSSLQPATSSLAEHRDEIVAAVDFLMQGF